MADPFAAFESAAETPANNNADGELDPAAEFLAREEAEFAKVVDDTNAFGLDEPKEIKADSDDLFGMASSNEQQENQESKDKEASDLIIGSAAATLAAANNLTANASENDDMLGLGEPLVSEETKPTVEPVVNKETKAPAEPEKPAKTDLYSAISSADKFSQEPEKIKIWREEQKQRLEQKDKEEEIKKKEWKDAAKKELEDWYKNRQDQLAKTHENNKAAEAELVGPRETQPGQEWERMAKLCDFNPKANKNTKDVSRMRSILLQLKQTPLVR